MPMETVCKTVGRYYLIFHIPSTRGTRSLTSTAPTFRILRLARYMVQSCPKEHISDVAKVLQHCFNCITVLYSRGKACPKDINSDGESIMHLVANLILRVSA